MTEERLQIFPSRANQVLIKQRTLAAIRGVNLLKRKRDAIDMKLRELKQDMQEREDISDDVICEAIFSFAKANFLGADFNIMQVEHVDIADAFIIKRTQKIVGITLPQLDLMLRSDNTFPLTGLGRGGSQVSKVRVLFQEALKNIIMCASVDFAVNMLTQASRQNNMRVNALDHIVIPRLQNTWNYIRDELEEFEREDFYRLKRSQAKQLEAKLAFSELIKTKNMTPSEKELYMKSGLHHHPVADVNFDLEEFESSEVIKRRSLYKMQDKKNKSEERISYQRRESTELEDTEISKPKPENDRSLQTDFEESSGTQTDPHP